MFVLADRGSERLRKVAIRPQVAEQLVIAPKTVATHVDHILSKLGVHSRAKAVALAYRRDLFETPSAGVLAD